MSKFEAIANVARNPSMAERLRAGSSFLKGVVVVEPVPELELIYIDNRNYDGQLTIPQLRDTRDFPVKLPY